MLMYIHMHNYSLHMYVRISLCIYIVNNYICIKYIYVAPTPRTYLMPNYSQKGIIGETLELICLIALSSTVSSTSVNLTWNFSSNDSRVTVIPTTITTDDSIGIIYTTVIQFAYLIEEDNSIYTCTLTIENTVEESVLEFDIISELKHNL